MFLLLTSLLSFVRSHTANLFSHKHTQPNEQRRDRTGADVHGDYSFLPPKHVVLSGSLTNTQTDAYGFNQNKDQIFMGGSLKGK